MRESDFVTRGLRGRFPRDGLLEPRLFEGRKLRRQKQKNRKNEGERGSRTARGMEGYVQIKG